MPFEFAFSVRGPIHRALLSQLNRIEAERQVQWEEKLVEFHYCVQPFARFEEELARSMNRQSGETAAARRQLQKIEAEIRNCTEAIASMGLSNSLRAKLVELEAQHGSSRKSSQASSPVRCDCTCATRGSLSRADCETCTRC